MRMKSFNTFLLLTICFIFNVRSTKISPHPQTEVKATSEKLSLFLDFRNMKMSKSICKSSDGIVRLSNVVENDSPKIYKWKEDSECRDLSVNFAKRGSLEARAIVSYPGSGNTWLRHLIESSTGLFTATLYHQYKSKEYLTHGFLGHTRPMNDGSTIVQKTHYFTALRLFNDSLLEKHVELSDRVFGKFGHRGILLIRNPFHAILSHWNLFKSKNKVGHAVRSSFSGTKWQTFVEIASDRWRELIQVWFEKSVDLHVVVYEELKTYTETELTRIHEYLRYEVDPLRMKCTLKHKEGPFLRKHTSEREGLMKSIYRDTLDISANFTLESIVQNHIDKLNQYFLERNVALQLHYKLIQ